MEDISRAVKFRGKRLLQAGFSWRWQNSPSANQRRHIDRMRNLRGAHEGQRAFIIGNGPSLREMDLNLMKQDATFACNAFFLEYERLDFRPTYFTVEDPLPAEDNREEISALDSSTKIIPWDLRRFIAEDEQTVYINFRRAYEPPGSDRFPRFSDQIHKECFWGGTVLFMNIQLAAYMGFNPIILIGVDLTYTIPDDVEQDSTVLTSRSDDPNHFNPAYFGPGKRWHLPEVARMQKGFTRAYEHLRDRKVDLLNATHGGALQDLPRVNYEDLFDSHPAGGSG